MQAKDAMATIVTAAGNVREVQAIPNIMRRVRRDVGGVCLAIVCLGAIWLATPANSARADEPTGAPAASPQGGTNAASPLGEIKRHYREALYDLDPLHQDLAAAGNALAVFLQMWTKTGDALPGHKPSEASIAAIAQLGAEGNALLRQGRGHDARQSLEQIRPLLDPLGDEASLTCWLALFDDKLAETSDDDFDQAEVTPSLFIQLCEQTGVLDFLANQLARHAPAQYTADPAYLEAQENIARQIRGLRVTVLRGQRDPIRAALTDLRLSLDRFYLLYG